MENEFISISIFHTLASSIYKKVIYQKLESDDSTKKKKTPKNSFIFQDQWISEKLSKREMNLTS